MLSIINKVYKTLAITGIIYAYTRNTMSEQAPDTVNELIDMQVEEEEDTLTPKQRRRVNKVVDKCVDYGPVVGLESAKGVLEKLINFHEHMIQSMHERGVDPEAIAPWVYDLATLRNSANLLGLVTLMPKPKED